MNNLANIPMSRYIVLAIIAVAFVALHIPGLSIPYHQDEYKWPSTVSSSQIEAGSIPHPPVGLFIYRVGGQIFGYDNFRLIPLLFGFANLLLLFYVVRLMCGLKEALWSSGLFAISFYSLLSSLMVDIDGAIMPFFFLLMLISYIYFLQSKRKFLWGGLICLFAVLGFLVKLSFIICILAMIVDYTFEKKFFSDKKKIFRYGTFAVGAIILLVGILFVCAFIFPFFKLTWDIQYWISSFVKISGKGWMQTFIQFMKSILYLSPLLVSPLFFADRPLIKKTRIFWLFISFGLVFYLVIFDFSGGTLDKYLQFLVLPLSIISGVIFAKGFENTESKLDTRDFVLISLAAVGIFAMQFFNHFVPALYPKTEWVNRILHLDWQFLFPFTGGSGPTGFYVSFLFMALMWVVCLIFVLTSFKIPHTTKKALLAVLIFGLFYNAVFIEEYLFGKINGSPYRLLDNAKEFIIKNDDIKKVVVYNDIGGFDIQKTGKYERRLYAAPQFENTYKEFFKDWNGYVLYIDIPKISFEGFYAGYLSRCKIVYLENDKNINSVIFKCGK